jgi:hypothetical protein
LPTLTLEKKILFFKSLLLNKEKLCAAIFHGHFCKAGVSNGSNFCYFMNAKVKFA